MYLCSTDHDLYVIRLFGMGRLRFDGQPDQDRNVVLPSGLHRRIAGPVADLHLRAPNLHIVRLFGMGRL